MADDVIEEGRAERGGDDSRPRSPHRAVPMSGARRISLAVALVAGLAMWTSATALASPPTANTAARVVRAVTTEYRDVGAAEAAGYAQFLTCVREPGEGSMGTHWVNGAAVSDATVDVAIPEAAMYETRRNGDLALIGVEYIVFQDLWDADNEGPPQLFGQDFHLVAAPNRYGIPAFYALHVWAWKHNPAGTFADWNPRVSCRYAQGEPI